MREEHRLRVIENRVLREIENRVLRWIFAAERDEVEGVW